MLDISQKKTILNKWTDRYKSLENAFYLPSADPFAPQKDQSSPTKIVVREMIVDMEKLNTDLANKSPLWNELEVYADVLIFPLSTQAYGSDLGDNFAFKLGGVRNQKATFFARSIQIVEENGTFANFNKDTQLTIYTSEIIGGSLSISGLDGDLRNFAALNLPEGAMGISITGSDTQAKEVWEVPSVIVAQGTPAYWLLESSFNVGSALMYELGELAGKILSWVSLSAGFGNDPEMKHLALNAANLQGFVSQIQSDIPFVPKLSADIYKGVTTEYIKAASKFEEYFNGITAQASEQMDFSAYVNANKELFTDQADVDEKLIAQMRKNVDQSEKVLLQNSEKLKDLVKYQGALYVARQAFKDGIEKYKEEQKRKAIIGVCMAVFEVGGSLAAMAAGDEAAAGTAVKGVEATAKAAEAAAETVSKIKKLVDAVKKIAKVIKKLADLVQKLKAAQEAIESLTKAKDLKVSDFTKGIEVKPKDDEIFDNAYWDVFTINVTEILSPYKDDIDGASGYLEQLRYLAVYGKALYANSLTLVSFRQKLFKLVLEAEVTKNQQARLEALVADEKTEAEHLQMMKVIGYQNLLRVKGRLIFYMSEWIAAYRYWAVSPNLPSENLPSLANTVAELQEKLGNIAALRADALKQFEPEPAPMNIAFTIDEPGLIEQLRKTRELSFIISPDDPIFQLEEHVEKGHPAKVWGRTRVNSVRAYLNDEAIPDPNMQIKLEITTSSHYYDRYTDTGLLEYVADSKSVEKYFEYMKSDQSHPTGDGKLPPEFEYDYFEPTAFTTWNIKILNRMETLNVDKLDAVTLHLRGSWAAYNQM